MQTIICDSMEHFMAACVALTRENVAFRARTSDLTIVITGY